MIVHRDIGDVRRDPRTALTMGTFDGVHKGHRLIIEELLRQKTILDGRSFVITFHPHPQLVLRRHGDTVPILTTIEERLELLKECGVDEVLVMPFTPATAATPWREFAQLLIDQIGIGHMIFGHDHAFGKNREGTAQAVRTLGEAAGFEVTEVSPLYIGHETVSSTKIRRALQGGELDLAEQYLGRHYSFQGRVIKGDGRGRSLGIPTANVEPLDPAKLIPMEGVYSVSMLLGDREVRGMANIGRRPTFTDGRERTIEANLFDFDEDIYHNVVTLVFRKFVRSERKFGSAEEFLEQLDRDRAFCREH